jgi:hypothetical protein
VPLSDSTEISLARSAAPPELADSAQVLAVHAGRVRVLHPGTSGSVCVVIRDFHPGSVYPICFNPEAARTSLQRELLQNRLRTLGVPEDSINRAVESATADGTLPAPRGFAVAYMMSPRQVLFSSPDADGVRVGAWHPHIMIYSPHTTRADIGLARPGPAAGVFSVGIPGTHHTEIIVKVPRWSDGTMGPGKP